MMVAATHRVRRSQGRAAGSGLLSGAQVWKAAGCPGLVAMPLKLRPTCLGPATTRTSPTTASTAASGASAASTETRTGPEALRWFWALAVPTRPAGLRTDNRAHR